MLKINRLDEVKSSDGENRTDIGEHDIIDQFIFR